MTVTYSEQVQVRVVGEVDVLKKIVLVHFSWITWNEACLGEVGVGQDYWDFWVGLEGELSLVGLLWLGFAEGVVA